MTEWIKFSEKKPKHDIIALVFNEKGFMNLGEVLAIYSHTYDVWRYYNRKKVETLTLEVSHYFPIPEIPKLL